MEKDMRIRLYIADALSEEEKEAFEKGMQEHSEIREEVYKLKSVWNMLDKWDIDVDTAPELKLPLRMKHFPIFYPAVAFAILGIILGTIFTRVSNNRYYKYVSYIERGFYEK